MDDMFSDPTPPPTTRYTRAFEACWKVHSVGVKKAAWTAGQKAGWTDANWAWLQTYLERRWKEDALWVKGDVDRKTGQVKKFVPHLSSIINGERWTDVYKKISTQPKKAVSAAVETPEEIADKLAQDHARIEQAKKQREVREEMRKRGLLH